MSSTPKYDALVEKVRKWANRDDVILTDSLIEDFLDYSADLCYRKLRIPPLEHVYSYPAITSSNEGDTSLQLPPDFSELISFSRKDKDGKRYTFSKLLDSNEFQSELTTVPENSFAFKNRDLIFNPKAKIGDVYEVHYYRRLFDLDAKYVVNQANIDNGYAESASQGDNGAVEFPSGSGTYYVGKEVSNWLRDENERVLLFGALAHALDYLGEEERSLRYFQKQAVAIDELNREETFTKSKGGSSVVSYEVNELI